MTTNTDRAADLIADATIPLGTSVARGIDRAILAAQTLADAGLLMPDLPGPYVGEESGIADWYATGWEISFYPAPNTHEIVIENRNRLGKPYRIHPTNAKEFAYALLAAANYAEQEQGNV